MNNKQKSLSKKEFTEVVESFRIRGYELLESPIKKVRKFVGDELPTVFLKRKEKGQYANVIIIHPLTPRELLHFQLLENKHSKNKDDPYLFRHDDVTPFPAIDGKTKNCLELSFHSTNELGEMLDNLIEIGPIEDTQTTTQQGESNKQKSATPLDLTAEVMSDLYTPTPLKTEGGKKLAFTYRYERDSELREQALRKFGYCCYVCEINFSLRYGKLGKDFIEVHHIVPVSEGQRETNYKNLVPLCPNCHRMIHRLYKELDPSQYKDAVDLLRKRLR